MVCYIPSGKVWEYIEITLPICLQTLSNLRTYTFVEPHLESAHTIIFITVRVNQHLKQYELHILEVYFAVKTCFL